MLMKISSKNQIVIPKAVLEQAGLSSQDVYFDVANENGTIVLKPMQVEEKIPTQSLVRFQKEELKNISQYKSYPSVNHVIAALHKKRGKT